MVGVIISRNSVVSYVLRPICCLEELTSQTQCVGVGKLASGNRQLRLFGIYLLIIV